MKRLQKQHKKVSNADFLVWCGSSHNCIDGQLNIFDSLKVLCCTVAHIFVPFQKTFQFFIFSVEEIMHEIPDVPADLDKASVNKNNRWKGKFKIHFGFKISSAFYVLINFTLATKEICFSSGLYLFGIEDFVFFLFWNFSLGTCCTRRTWRCFHRLHLSGQLLRPQGTLPCYNSNL